MTPDDVPPPTNRFFRRRGDPGGGGRLKPAVQKAVLLLIAAALVAGGLAFKFGWFPFDDRSQLRDELKAAVVERSKLPFETLEITGDGLAVGTLPDGERLAIRWARDAAGTLRSVCQRPHAEMEQFLRTVAAERYGPVRSLTLRPSAVGVGYVGELVLTSGEILDVVETTDLDEMWAYQDFWQSKKTYPIFATRLLETEAKTKVKEIGEARAGDLPPQAAGTERLYTARMRTVTGEVFAVELYRDTLADGQAKAAEVWGEVKIRYVKLGS